MRVLSWSSALFLLLSPQYIIAETVNCEGSGMCGGTRGYKGKWHGGQIIDYLYDQMLIWADSNGTTTAPYNNGTASASYNKGVHLVCMPSMGDSPPGDNAFKVGDYGICVFPNKHPITGREATQAVKGIKDHGCKKCGSNAGVTINYVKHICSNPLPLNWEVLSPICQK